MVLLLSNTDSKKDLALQLRVTAKAERLKDGMKHYFVALPYLALTEDT